MARAHPHSWWRGRSGRGHAAGPCAALSPSWHLARSAAPRSCPAGARCRGHSTRCPSAAQREPAPAWPSPLRMHACGCWERGWDAGGPGGAVLPPSAWADARAMTGCCHHAHKAQGHTSQSHSPRLRPPPFLSPAPKNPVDSPARASSQCRTQMAQVRQLLSQDDAPKVGPQRAHFLVPRR